MKLTAAQMRALEVMTGGRVGEKFMPATVKSLVKLGLAERTFGAINYSPRYSITPAGRAALEQHAGGRK